MSGDDSNSEPDGIELSRRTFTKAAGAAAGAGLLGGAAGTAGAQGSIDRTEFANPRVQEVAKVWARGFRGQSDRAIGLTDSGIDARHPDLGPWNGVKAVEENGELVLQDQSVINYERTSKDDFEESATVTPGTTATGDETVVYTFTPQSPKNTVDAELSWMPTENDLEFRLDKADGNGGWEEVATAATANNPEVITEAPLKAGVEHRFVAESYANAGSEAIVSGTTYERIKMFTDGEATVNDPFTHGPDNAKTVGWVNPVSRYGDYDEPRDPDGHGSHCASIMGGSGRASAFDEYTEESYDSQRVQPGNPLTFYVTAEEGEGVFASAYGTNLEIEISRPFSGVVASSTIGSDTSTLDNNVVSVPADEHLSTGQQDGTFRIDIRGGQPGDRQDNRNYGAGKVETVAYGTLADPSEGISDRTDADGAASLHSGVAPNSSLVGLQGLSGPIPVLAEYADTFTSEFNLRAINMSWGYTGGLPLGAAGGEVSAEVVEGIKQMAQNGILTVAAAGNTATPANGNGAPAVADEAISVVATDARDGVAAYSSGGVGARDEDDQGNYMKPDVTAPGGSVPDLAQAAEAGAPDESESEQPPIRDYTGKAGTSMASPFVNGTAALVAEAMEEAAPESVSLPEPADTSGPDVARLKQVILATASETAFTAAPYHRGKAPTYQFGDRDPYEGYGRVNPDAAVDAVGRTLLDDSDAAPGGTLNGTLAGTVGLDVPADSRAVAGYVEPAEGELTVTLDLPSGTDVDGEDVAMAKGPAHIDLFVYDAENPGIHGEPNVVAKDSTRDGSAAEVRVKTDGSTFNSFDFDTENEESSRFGSIPGRTLFVVAKLVNVPSLVNGFDYRANLTLDASLEVNKLPNLSASGQRSDDGTEFLAGEDNQINVRLSEVPALLTEDDEGNTVPLEDDNGDPVEATVWDELPADWSSKRVYGKGGDFDTRSKDGRLLVNLGTVTGEDFLNGGNARFAHIASAPDANGVYEFGPARVEIADQGSDGDGKVTVDDTDYRVARENSDQTEIAAGSFSGSDRNVVVGGTEPATSSGDTSLDDGTDTVSDGVSDATAGDDGGSSGGSDDGSVTGTVGDTVDDTL
jgi:subtilisin family serine protease